MKLAAYLGVLGPWLEAALLNHPAPDEVRRAEWREALCIQFLDGPVYEAHLQ